MILETLDRTAYRSYLRGLYGDLIKKVPGGVTLPTWLVREHIRDRHSLLYGEARRLRFLLKKLREERLRLSQTTLTPKQQHDVLLRILHAHFVGDPDDDGARHARMYRGTLANFSQDRKLWREACDDVEAFYAFLIERLPRNATIGDRRRDLHLRLRRPEEVSKTWDPIVLLDAAVRSPDRLVRHFARQKLAFAQMSWELRRGRLNPFVLAERSTQLEGFVKRTLLGGQAGERVHVVCDLDPQNAYRCRAWQVVEPGAVLPEQTPHRAVFPVTRYSVVVEESGESLPVLFFIRPKKHPLLKVLIKRIRFLDLAGIGDGVAMMFVIEHEHLDKLVEQVRRILVRCPGQVCDQGSSIGHRNGQRADETNQHSSADYEVMKYICKLWEEVAEFQFVPTISWANAKCSHDRVNHDWYKSMQVTADLLPICFPEHLFGIIWPWGFDQHGMPSFNRTMWGEMIAHVLRRGYEF